MFNFPTEKCHWCNFRERSDFVVVGSRFIKQWLVELHVFFFPFDLMIWEDLSDNNQLMGLLDYYFFKEIWQLISSCPGDLVVLNEILWVLGVECKSGKELGWQNCGSFFLLQKFVRGDNVKSSPITCKFIWTWQKWAFAYLLTLKNFVQMHIDWINSIIESLL